MFIYKISRARRERRNIEMVCPEWKGRIVDHETSEQEWTTSFRSHEGHTIQAGDQLHIRLTSKDVRDILGATCSGAAAARLTTEEWGTWIKLCRKLYLSD